MSRRYISDRLSVSLVSVQQWIRYYRSMSEDAFAQKNYKHYYLILKLSAVQSYLAGEVSQQDICEKYSICSKSKLQMWIKKYNGNEILKSSRIGGFYHYDKRTKDNI